MAFKFVTGPQSREESSTGLYKAADKKMALVRGKCEHSLKILLFKMKNTSFDK